MLELHTRVDEGHRRAVEAALQAHNDLASPVLRALRERGETDARPLDVYALDGETLVGGLVGSTWARWLEVDLLWVRDDQRGQGLGGRLLAEAERVARDERSCLGVRLSTWDFQARPFYEANGYVVYGVLEDHPPGATDYQLAKRLDG